MASSLPLSEMRYNRLKLAMLAADGGDAVLSLAEGLAVAAASASATSLAARRPLSIAADMVIHASSVASPAKRTSPPAAWESLSSVRVGGESSGGAWSGAAADDDDDASDVDSWTRSMQSATATQLWVLVAAMGVLSVLGTRTLLRARRGRGSSRAVLPRHMMVSEPAETPFKAR